MYNYTYTVRNLIQVFVEQVAASCHTQASQHALTAQRADQTCMRVQHTAVAPTRDRVQERDDERVLQVLHVLIRRELGRPGPPAHR